MYSKMHRARRSTGAPQKLATPLRSMRTTSPGATSRQNSAPMWSRAQLSEASTNPPSSRPRPRGRHQEIGYYLRVCGGSKLVPLLSQLAAKVLGVDDIAVMPQGQFPQGTPDQYRLGVGEAT